MPTAKLFTCAPLFIHTYFLGINSLTPRLEESMDNSIVPPKSLSMRSLSGNISLESRNAISHPDIRKKSPEPSLSEAKYKWWESQEINLGSSINIFNEPKPEAKKKVIHVVEEINEPETFIEKFIKFFDLTLLSDPIFVNILIGLSVAACVETNFSLLLPIILKDMLKFETDEIAKVMAVIGFSDTLFRFVSPFIGEWCNKPPRVMYLVGLLLIVFTRTSKYSTAVCINDRRFTTLLRVQITCFSYAFYHVFHWNDVCSPRNGNHKGSANCVYEYRDPKLCAHRPTCLCIWYTDVC